MDDRNVLIIMCVAMCLASLVSIVLFWEYWTVWNTYIWTLEHMSTHCFCYNFNITNMALP